MKGVLSEILKTGATKTARESGGVKLYSSIFRFEGELLQKLVRELDPTASLQVGLAHGVSALFICDALSVRNGTQYIAIDPYQNGGPWDWHGIGIASLRRAGCVDIVQLIETLPCACRTRAIRTARRFCVH
jgi:predicted O-methyltransferase YrrM